MRINDEKKIFEYSNLKIHKISNDIKFLNEKIILLEENQVKKEIIFNENLEKLSGDIKIIQQQISANEVYQNDLEMEVQSKN